MKKKDLHKDFDIILNNIMNAHGFTKTKPKNGQPAVTYFISNKNKNHILAYDIIWNRIGVYINGIPVEQFFFICTPPEKKTFLEWLKKPVFKSTVHITIENAVSRLLTENQQ